MKNDDEVIPNARHWVATANDEPYRSPVFIECERFFDARVVARRVLGSPEVSLAQIDARAMRVRPARVQARWEGAVPGARLRVRSVDKRGRASTWEDL